jgi:uncharacterized protein YjbI with pentapeptide repeats
MPRAFRIFDLITAAILPETDEAQQREAQNARIDIFAGAILAEAAPHGCQPIRSGLQRCANGGRNLNGPTLVDADLSNSGISGSNLKGASVLKGPGVSPLDSPAGAEYAQANASSECIARRALLHVFEDPISGLAIAIQKHHAHAPGVPHVASIFTN